MKRLCLLILIILTTNLSAQEFKESKRVFLRVYDATGNKIGKGRFFKANDSLLVLRRNGKNFEIQISKIEKIKTKHSAGHNILVGGIIGGTTAAAIGAATSKEETKTRNLGFPFGEYEYTSGVSSGTGAALGGIIGITGGSIIGGITALFKKCETFEINGDYKNFEIFLEAILGE